MEDTLDRPWSRRPKESADAYEAFVAYRNLGSKRSIEQASRKCNKHASILGRWSTKWGWVARALSWDDALQAERDKVALAEAAKWEKRRIQAVEANWALSQKLRAKAERMLDTPLLRTRAARDGQPVIVEPVRWTFAHAILAAKVAVEIEQAALQAASPPLEQCTDAELKAIEDAAFEPPAGWDQPAGGS